MTSNNSDAAPHPHPISVLSTRVPSVSQPAVFPVTSVPAQAQAQASSSSLCINTQSSTEMNAENGQSTSVASENNASLGILNPDAAEFYPK